MGSRASVDDTAFVGADLLSKADATGNAVEKSRLSR